MFSLPDFALVCDGNAGEQEQPIRESFMDKLERKVATNTIVLISRTDTRNSCERKLADCLTDAVGLSVDFSSLAA